MEPLKSSFSLRHIILSSEQTESQFFFFKKKKPEKIGSEKRKRKAFPAGRWSSCNKGRAEARERSIPEGELCSFHHEEVKSHFFFFLERRQKKIPSFREEKEGVAVWQRVEAEINAKRTHSRTIYSTEQNGRLSRHGYRSLHSIPTLRKFCVFGCSAVVGSHFQRFLPESGALKVEVSALSRLQLVTARVIHLSSQPKWGELVYLQGKYFE